MQTAEPRVLLVEDDPDDYIIVRDLLSEIEGSRFELDWVTSYDAGLDAIDREQHDVYLLDYRLGERTGLDLMKQSIENGCKAPMILLTGQGDRAIDLEAMNAGADDYLVKGRIYPDMLERSIRYAIERHRLLAEIERRQQELEVRSLEWMSRPQAADASPLGEAWRLREALPEAFEELVGRYGDLLDMVLEQESYKEGYDVSEELNSIGGKLGELNITAADVLAIHTEAFKRKLKDAKSQKAQAYMRESRLLVIELMGKLVSHYRNIYLHPRGTAEKPLG